MSLEPNAFIGKSEKPTDDELAQALGTKVKKVWDQIVAEVGREFQINEQEWNSYSLKSGWSYRLKRKKRTIIHFGPRRGHFQVAFILGDRAIRAAGQCRLPRRVMKIIEEAPRYPEGTGVRIEVKGLKDLPSIMKLAKVKLEN